MFDDASVMFLARARRPRKSDSQYERRWNIVPACYTLYTFDTFGYCIRWITALFLPFLGAFAPQMSVSVQLLPARKTGEEQTVRLLTFASKDSVLTLA